MCSHILDKTTFTDSDDGYFPHTDIGHSFWSVVYSRPRRSPFGCEDSKLYELSIRHAILIITVKNNILVSPEKRALLTDFGASRIESLHTGYTNRAVNETIRWKAVELFKLIEEGDVPSGLYV